MGLLSKHVISHIIYIMQVYIIHTCRWCFNLLRSLFKLFRANTMSLLKTTLYKARKSVVLFDQLSHGVYTCENRPLVIYINIHLHCPVSNTHRKMIYRIELFTKSLYCNTLVKTITLDTLSSCAPCGTSTQACRMRRVLGEHIVHKFVLRYILSSEMFEKT